MTDQPPSAWFPGAVEIDGAGVYIALGDSPADTIIWHHCSGLDRWDGAYIINHTIVSGRGDVLLDGEPLTGVTGVTFTGKAGDVPRLEVSLVLHEVEIDGEATVILPDNTRASLIALGWTPPVDLEKEPQA